MTKKSTHFYIKTIGKEKYFAFCKKVTPETPQQYRLRFTEFMYATKFESDYFAIVYKSICEEAGFNVEVVKR